MKPEIYTRRPRTWTNRTQEVCCAFAEGYQSLLPPERFRRTCPLCTLLKLAILGMSPYPVLLAPRGAPPSPPPYATRHQLVKANKLVRLRPSPYLLSYSRRRSRHHSRRFRSRRCWHPVRRASCVPARHPPFSRTAHKEIG